MTVSSAVRFGSLGLLATLLALPVLSQQPPARPPEPKEKQAALPPEVVDKSLIPTVPPGEKSTLPAAFDLRDVDGITPIKAQAGGTCWTHGTVAAIESHLLMSGYWRGSGRSGLPALSEYHLDWWNGFNMHCNEDVADPAKQTDGLKVHLGGDYRVATAYLSRGEGFVVMPGSKDVYRDSEWYAKAPPRSDADYQKLYVRDVEWFTIGDELEGIEVLKRRIMTEGALGTCYAAGRYTAKDFVQYQPISSRGDPNHAVAIVGWDDTKISTDPEKKAPKPGAWLIKNSWGTRRGDQGYFWISYYDKHCCRYPEMGAVSFRNIEPQVYTDIYSHDVHGWRDTLKDVSKAFNAFTTTGKQLVRAVSFYSTQHDVQYTVTLHNQFANGELGKPLATKSGTIPYCGFHTINWDTPVFLNGGEKFYVCVEVSKGGQAIDRTSQIPVLLQQPEPKAKSEQPAPAEAKGKSNQPPPGEPKGKGRGGRVGPQVKPWVPSKANPGESYYHDGKGWKDLQDYKFADAKFNKTANFCIKALAVAAEESPNRRFKAMLDSLPARSVGPANMGGRITDVAVVESDPKIMYAAAATGGVWKTTDAGTTWTPVFDQQDTLSIGAVAVAPSDPNVVYVGTGEANPRNSVIPGRGIYRSSDGGKTWSFGGMAETHHIGRIVVHPKYPDLAYAAALGHLWGPNRERGVYKTTDGGKTWRAIKTIDENIGFVDLALDPTEPDTLYASAYPVRRDGFSGGAPATQWAIAGGLYKSTDGGKTWNRMKSGLPERPIGRCGISICRKDPKIVYAVVQTDKTDGPTDNRGQVAKTNDGDVDKGGIFRSDDKGATWKKVNDLVPRPFYYGQIRVDPNDDQRVYVLGVALSVSSDGGKTFASPRIGTHGDHHALWINPADSKHLVLGNDGGLYSSKDAGKNWTAHRGMAIGQLYAVALDNSTPYRIYGGFQDNGSWHGPTATDRSEGITLADWKKHDGGDGFQSYPDPTDPHTVYAEQQYGRPARIKLNRAAPPGGGVANDGNGDAPPTSEPKPANADAAQPKAAAKGKARDNNRKRLQPTAPKDQPPYRFNWHAPFVMSSHDPKTLYLGGNMVFKSTNRGDSWQPISPDLTRAPAGEKRSFAHTLSALTESPLKAGLLYAGSDDGRLHVTRDGGKSWIDITDNIPGVSADRWINRIECSHHAEGTAYLAITRYRNDDARSYTFKTTNYGMSWSRLTTDLPYDIPVYVVRESSKNKNLLFAGTETGLYASIDGGQRWQRVKNGLPASVPVHDLTIHPRDRELVIATHGRSAYVMDIAPLEELDSKVWARGAYVFTVRPNNRPAPPAAETKANGAFCAPNPPAGTAIYYHLAAASSAPATITVCDKAGQVIATLTGPANKGLNCVRWQMPRDKDDGQPMDPADLTVVLKCGNQEARRPITEGEVRRSAEGQ